MYACTSRYAYKSTLLLDGQKNVQNSRPAYRSTPLVYRLPSDVADVINSIPRDAVVRKVREYCDQLTADHSKVRRGAVSNSTTMIWQ